MRTILLILCCAAISGCQTDPVIPSVVKVPVLISCVKEAPEKPQTASETEILAMTDYAATIMTWTERLLLKSYAEKADAIIQACSAP